MASRSFGQRLIEAVQTVASSVGMIFSLDVETRDQLPGEAENTTSSTHFESSVKAEQALTLQSPALLDDPIVKLEASDICDNVSSGTRRMDRQTHVHTLRRPLKDICIKCQEMEKRYQYLFHDNQKILYDNQILIHENHSLLHDNQRLHNESSCMSRQNQDLAPILKQLQATNADLSRQNDELKRKYSKKVDRYKELDKNYMELVRPLQVSDDDYSTVFNRMVHVRVSIETMIQKAKGDGSVNLNREAAIAHFKKAGLTQDFPVEESLLEPYHLNLLMESATMTVLIDHFFNRPLGCIFDQSEEFQNVSKWVENRDDKVATRWRQQLYLLIVQDSKAMESRREKEVCRAAETLYNLVCKVYRDTNMSVKLRELCYNAFDLSLALCGMETVIYPASTPLGTPFDSTTMTTPHKSNPQGIVSLVIFPTFKDKNVFSINPKVWCY